MPGGDPLSYVFHFSSDFGVSGGRGGEEEGSEWGRRGGGGR